MKLSLLANNTSAAIPAKLAAYQSPKIKVLVAKNLSQFKIEGFDLKKSDYSSGRTIQVLGQKEFSETCKSIAPLKTVKHKPGPSLVASYESRTGFLTIDGDRYQGIIHVVSDSSQDRCDLISEQDLEHYLSTLLSKEMNPNWEIEALKAQAVAARTYALKKINSNEVSKLAGFETFYHLENSEKHQVSGSFADQTVKTQMAARLTKGEVLVDPNGSLTSIFFHAKCGGKTITPENVWANKVAGYKSVDCPCHTHSASGWKYEIEGSRLVKFFDWLGKNGKVTSYIQNFEFKNLGVFPDNIDKRNIRFYLGDLPILFRKAEFRKFFGNKNIFSNRFVVKKNANKLVMYGQGRGHGVGLCQTGAKYQAMNGSKYQTILSHYFPKHALKKIY